MKYEYIRNYLDLEYYNETYDELRTELHEKIINSYFDNLPINSNPNPYPTIIFTSGAYGSGKSHIIKLLEKHKKINLKNFIYIDPDKLRIELPEYTELLKVDPWNAGMKTNKEIFYISSLIKYHALFTNHNVIYDSSLKDGEWFSQYFLWLKKTFPKIIIKIIHVKTNWTNVLERNLLRAEQTKRCIPLKFIRDAYHMSSKSNEILKNYVDENIIIINDNDGETMEQIRNLPIIF